MPETLPGHDPRTVKIDGKAYVVAQKDGSPVFASGQRVIEGQSNDDFEVSWSDWSGGVGVDYYSSQNFLTTIKGRIQPRPTVSALTPPLFPGYKYRWKFEAKDAAGNWYTYFISPKAIMKVQMAATPVIRQLYTAAGRFGNTNDFYGEPIKGVNGGTVYWFIPCNNGDRIAYIAETVATETAAAAAFGTAATLTSDITAAATSLEYTSAGDPIAKDDMIQIDSEVMYVSAVNTGTNTCTVIRAQQGTTAATHTATTAINYKAGDSITISSAVIKGGAHFKQLPSGKIARATSSHSAGTAQNRAEISLLAAGGSFLTDASWGEDFPVDSQTKWIIGLEAYGELIVIGKQNGWFTGKEQSDGRITFEDILPDDPVSEMTDLGEENISGGCVWHGSLILSTLWHLQRSNIYSAKPIDAQSLYDITYIPIIATLIEGRSRTPEPTDRYLFHPYDRGIGTTLFIAAGIEREAGEIAWHPFYFTSGGQSECDAVFVVRNGAYGNSLWWIEGSTAQAVKYMKMTSGLLYNATDTYGNASLTCSLWGNKVKFPCQVLLREMRYVIEGGDSNSAWSFRAVLDGDTGDTAVGSTITATGSIFWTAGSNDKCRTLVPLFRLALGASYTAQSASTTIPSLVRATLCGTYLPDVSDEMVFEIDSLASAQLRNTSQKAIYDELRALTSAGAKAWVDMYGQTGYVNVRETEEKQGTRSWLSRFSLGRPNIVVRASLIEYS